ncbi:MAG TPA: hypothetical protein VK745_06810 [Polyangiaceae bacterium]|jgi:hypothetical protein|nr:hypothetical protein [Polyangiaceae bacterium]
MSARELPVYVLLASLCVGRVAHAQTNAANGAATSAPSTAASAKSPALAPITALPLTLSLGDSKLDPEVVRRAIELELKRPVAVQKVQTAAEGLPEAPRPSLLVVVHADHTASVAYRAENGVTRTRSIGLPQDSARSAEVIALLSGNLARDEAAELLASLAARSNSANAPPQDTPSAEAPSNPPGATATNEPPKAAAPAPTPAKSVATKKTAPTFDGDLLTTPYPAFDLTLLPPLSLIRNSERHVINAELGLVYSHVGELYGVGFNVLVLHTERTVRGLSFASLYNQTDRGTDGVSASGVLNRAGSVQGFAFGGVGNFQADLKGGALAGVVSRTRDGRGVEVAGILSIARDFSGLQLAGVTNVARELSGAQLGVVNVAGDVHGVQIGVVNVAKHVDGGAIGLVSIADNGRIQPVLWASTFMPLNAAVKFTVGLLYSELGGSYRPSDHTYAAELGFGAHLPLGTFFIEPGAHYMEQRDTSRSFSYERLGDVHYRVAAGLDLHAVSPFLGAAIVERVEHAADVGDSHPVSFEGFAGAAFF